MPQYETFPKIVDMFVFILGILSSVAVEELEFRCHSKKTHIAPPVFPLIRFPGNANQSNKSGEWKIASSLKRVTNTHINANAVNLRIPCDCCLWQKKKKIRLDLMCVQ